ncbi:purine operon repressor [Sporomusaceae bacterium BoRhaA]|uniref:pur operon repressor n=1 Tax=Pelorhabdus rhamnosifermentans TaxID=2772457 RepID=UPI001C05F509|nr:pur operon repressor [Pelorhabdus rhamnosifermentans]MBU2702138.1 purine operon repressor [Pelorhabdus rhamnosifermentans]
MDKVRRIDRLIAITKVLVDHPHRLFSLSYFNGLFDAAKSTLSEDVLTIKQSLVAFDMGTLETVSGAAGGVRYLPYQSVSSIHTCLETVARHFRESDRIIAGGFIYMSDILFDSSLMATVSEIFLTKFSQTKPDYIMTVETKGIPLALMTARAFHVPLVIVRRGSRVTEGSAVSINYVTGSSHRIQTMSLPRRAIQSGSRVLIIDDFMKAGGTARGMVDLAREVGAETVGIGVLVATREPIQKLVEKYTALLILQGVDEHNKRIDIQPIAD